MESLPTRWAGRRPCSPERRLRSDPSLGGRVQRRTPAGGGYIDLLHDGINAELKVAEGEADRAVNIAGGLHHAMADRASGFCVYNDPAIAIARLLDLGATRIAYIDVDVHHGDGVQEIFYADPRVLTVSLHETPLALFPGTGFPTETGAPGAEGSAVNVALPPGTGDPGWLRAFHAVVPSVVRAFAPEVVISQCGADGHRLDPLADLRLTVDGQRESYLAMRALLTA